MELNLKKVAEKQENYRARKSKDKHIILSDLVLLHTPATKPGQFKKFSTFDNHPYRVKATKNVVNFQISHINNLKDTQWVHVDRLTKIENRLFFPSFYEAENSSNTYSVSHLGDQSTGIAWPLNSNNYDNNNSSSNNNNDEFLFYTYKVAHINIPGQSDGKKFNPGG